MPFDHAERTRDAVVSSGFSANPLRRRRFKAFPAEYHNIVRRHPERSRFSGGAKNLARTGPVFKGTLHRHRAPATALSLVVCLLALVPSAHALGQKSYIETVRRPGSLIIAHGKALATIFVDSNDYAGVVRAAHDLQADIARVTGGTPTITTEYKKLGTNAIIIGTVGKSTLIDRLIAEKKIDVLSIAGKWESFLIQTVTDPLPGVSRGLVIAGSDKRGTIYGTYDLSEQIGVSPWYWWADVPVQHKDELYVKPGRYLQGPPAVKYRGIFLNDEAPALTGWVNEKFGGYNHNFYVKVFELLLRLKANYLWPAMWNSAFNEEDPLNPKLADEYGIVMGTSHHEPMLRAQQEWKRHGKGPWGYSTNAEVLRNFWKEGVERNKNYESILTLGMRGDGDLPMSEKANVDLLEKIVADQRKIIASSINPNLSEVPQDWALYKEVQEYYEKGMRVPDDVTLLWCDDNWGNVRRLPTQDERKRSGGAGIYYHFDYVGGPRSYKWLNTIPITKIWEQMSLAYEYGADRIWVVNVGDLKPMEFPIEFFLNLAWNPQRWPKETLSEFGRLWAAREFGPQHAGEIASIVARYTKYNGRRKPELLEPNTFSLTDYQEADLVLDEWRSIVEKAERLYRELPENMRDAFFQLVLYPAKASAQVTELYITAGRNQLYANQGRASANDLAVKARNLFREDAELSDRYNHTLANGKWNHMMDQTHIGYTSWNEPAKNDMPEVWEFEIPAGAKLGVSVEGSASAWPGPAAVAMLPGFDGFNRQRRYIDVFNRGRLPFEFRATASVPWILLSATRGTIDGEQRVWVSIDWDKAPKGTSVGQISVARISEPPVTVRVKAFNPQTPTRASLTGFAEADGYVSIEAEHYTKKVDELPVQWEKIEDYGRTLSSMTISPVTAQSVIPPQKSPHLEYRMYLFGSGQVQVDAIMEPTLNFVPGRGLRYAISFDDQRPTIIDALEHNSLEDWETSVKDSVRKVRSVHRLAEPGYHTLKFWMVDPGIVLQKLVVDLGGMRPSYLGPPESYRGGRPEPVRP
ncbi:MAG: glycosyl hydrolase 115 family protein [Acidobacteriia bacterium]|nr:glycosyl hydrolase 115 family protein [Terriglobia bacterium]